MTVTRSTLAAGLLSSVSAVRPDVAFKHSPVLNTFDGPIDGFVAADGPDPLVKLRNPEDGCIDATLQQIVPVELREFIPCHKMVGDPFHNNEFHHVPEDHGVIGEPGSEDHGWLKSGVNRACHDPETCGKDAYGESLNERCRDAFCAGCSLGTCSTLVEAQACCLEADDCTAVYGGGEHWWTFSGECVEEDHPNYYNVFHRGENAVALPPSDAPPGDFQPVEPQPTDAPVTAAPQPTDAPVTAAPQPTDAPVTAPPLPTGAPVLNENFPAGLLRCDGGTPAVKTSCSANLQQLNADIREAVKNHHHSLPEVCDDNTCPRGDFAGCLVRLVGHDIMDFNGAQNTGGADGCIDFVDPDNLGLKGCMLQAVVERDSVNISLESMWQDFCTVVSSADFFVIAAEALIEATVPADRRADWGQAFAQKFRFGRQTQFECHPEPLPNPAFSCDAVEENFVDRLGLSWTQAAALMGVHTLGRALPENSGFDGFWVSQHHARLFTNQYFINMIAVGWERERVASSGKFQWKRADNRLPGEMMLNTDMCLAYQAGTAAPFTRAEDGNFSGCCLWMHVSNPGLAGVQCECRGIDGTNTHGCTHGNCCGGGGGCPGSMPDAFSRSVRSPAANEALTAVTLFAQKEGGMESWLAAFIPTWTKVTTQGHEQNLCPM